MDIDIAKAAVGETFEALCFMEAESADEGAGITEEEKMCWSRLDLKSPVNGEMVVVMPMQLLKDIISIVYGEDEAPQENNEAVLQDQDIDAVEAVDERVFDTLGEIVNTLAGNILKRIVPEDQAFTISLPEVGEGCGNISGMEAYMFKVSGYTIGLYSKTD